MCLLSKETAGTVVHNRDRSDFNPKDGSMKPTNTSRRQFLKQVSQLTVIGGAAPYVWIKSAGAAGVSPNEKLGVGCIGLGSRGSYVAGLACNLGNKVASADVDRSRAESFAGGGPCVAYTDYRKVLDRKDVDVVTIGTPDHWHTRIAIDAMKAGKDVYCEKPLTLTIDEGKKLCQVVRNTRRVLQVGTQQRSIAQFLWAVAIAQSGRLGKRIKATCGLGEGQSSACFPTTDPPAGLDWNMWLGQSPLVPYTPQRCHKSFRYWLEYSGGRLTDWGAHHLDIAQWALGYDLSGPVEVEGRGEFPNFPKKVDPVAFFAGRAMLPNGYNTATTFEATLSFGNGSSIVACPGKSNGILLEGEDGRIHVNRGRITGEPIEELSAADRARFADQVVRLYKGRSIDPEAVVSKDPVRGSPQASVDHMADFFTSVRDRRQPISDVFSHHRAVSSCHLCNIAMLLRRKLRWDPRKEDFVDDEQASALVSRPQREPYTISV
jgi:myo-inositol 2-dehydrogenase / D-chiro-inositol 1-dehydrogenase